MTLFEQVSASMPTKNILAHTIKRRRVLRSKFIPAPKPYREPPKPEPKALPKPADNHMRDWQTSIRFAFEVLHERIGDGRFIAPANPSKPIGNILFEVSKKHGIEINLIRKVDGYASRKVPIVRARQEFFYRACKETYNSLPAIGRYLGGFDHTTVLHGRDAHAKLLKEGDA